ncbi:expressed unknown protein [Seminavis robusta]|uniref:SnoaL-like domain-containing protein n=1 Tax=Seminavis robusta TaxID=568900 RepID=A0A9N8HA35_9STRA|nr:expressed unknown protein [Seminavis robusta]|eukprot:Sro212_g088100.1 n/a (157) ;mRNA; r:14167-14637
MSSTEAAALDDARLNEVGDFYLACYNEYFTGNKSFDETFGSIVADDIVFSENMKEKVGLVAFKEYYETAWKPAFAGYEAQVIQRFRPFGTNILSFSIIALADLHIDCQTGMSPQTHTLHFNDDGKIVRMEHLYALSPWTLKALGKLQEMAAASGGK